MKNSFKIRAISLGLGLASLSTFAMAQPAISRVELKSSIGKAPAVILLKGGGHSGGRRPRVPGGSGCDDPHDLIEHPECTAGMPTSTSVLPPAAVISSIDVYADGSVEIRYSNGWKEELSNGRYELKDPKNTTVISRTPTADDISRIGFLAGL